MEEAIREYHLSEKIVSNSFGKFNFASYTHVATTPGPLSPTLAPNTNPTQPLARSNPGPDPEPDLDPAQHVLEANEHDAMYPRRHEMRLRLVYDRMSFHVLSGSVGH